MFHFHIGKRTFVLVFALWDSVKYFIVALCKFNAKWNIRFSVTQITRT